MNVPVATVSGAAWVGVVSGAVTAIIGTVTIAAWIGRRMVRALVEVFEPMIRRLIAQQLASLGRIERQVTPNGGQTTDLATKVLQMERRQIATRSEVEHLRRLIATLLKRLGYAQGFGDGGADAG